MRRVITSLLLLSCAGFAQRAASFSKDVQQFVKYDQPVIVLENVQVVDGTGAAAKDGQMVVIRDGKIESIATQASDQLLPKDAKVLDLKGYTVIPGLVGMHDHMYYPAPGGQPAMYPEHASSFPHLYLAGGVTTIRTTGSVETYTDLEVKKLIDTGKMAGPKIYATGGYLEGKGSFAPQMHELTGPEDAREFVRYWADQGVTSFKAYMHITRDELRAAIEEAHKRHIKVTGHLCSITFKEATDLGIDDLEHGWFVDSEFVPDKKPDECPSQAAIREQMLKLDAKSGPGAESIKYLIAHHVAVTSTLPVFETFVPNRAPTDQRVLDTMLPEAREQYLAIRQRTATSPAAQSQPQLFKKEMEMEREFVRQGGTLLAGLDPTGFGGVIAGYGDQREVELLVEAGFTPVEAIKIATANGAEWLGDKTIGTLAPGNAADIVVIKGDPSKEIKDIENVETVFKDGIGYDPAKLAASAKGQVGLR